MFVREFYRERVCHGLFHALHVLLGRTTHAPKHAVNNLPFPPNHFYRTTKHKLISTHRNVSSYFKMINVTERVRRSGRCPPSLLRDFPSEPVFEGAVMKVLDLEGVSLFVCLSVSRIALPCVFYQFRALTMTLSFSFFKGYPFLLCRESRMTSRLCCRYVDDLILSFFHIRTRIENQRPVSADEPRTRTFQRRPTPRTRHDATYHIDSGGRRQSFAWNTIKVWVFSVSSATW